MFTLLDTTKENLRSLAEALEQGETVVLIESPGGDFINTLECLDEIKTKGLGKDLTLRIRYAASAAAYLVLALECKKILEPGGRVIVHGGRIEAEVNEILAMEEKIKLYYHTLVKFLIPLLSSIRMATYIVSNELELTLEECKLAGITTSLE